jgi:predicted aconitase with swiveling domain
VISGIPLIDKFDKDPIEVIKTGMLLKVNGNNGVVEVINTKDNSQN